MNRSLVFDLAACALIGKREDALFLGPGGTGKSHLAQAIGQAAIQQGYRGVYRETHVLLDGLAEAVADGSRKEFMESLATVPLLIIDDFGMRKLPLTAPEVLLEIVMRRYERASTLVTSNRASLKTGERCWAAARNPISPFPFPLRGKPGRARAPRRQHRGFPAGRSPCRAFRRDLTGKHSPDQLKMR